MAETKYGKLIKTDPLERFDHIYPEISAISYRIRGEKDWGGIQHEMIWLCLDKPVFMIKEAHSHDFDQFLVFQGGNPMDLEDFDAEVELCLGPEQEKHTITTTSLVHIPKDMIHCPLNFKRIGKPIVFMNIALASEYVRKPLTK